MIQSPILIFSFSLFLYLSGCVDSCSNTRLGKIRTWRDEGIQVTAKETTKNFSLSLSLSLPLSLTHSHAIYLPLSLPHSPSLSSSLSISYPLPQSLSLAVSIPLHSSHLLSLSLSHTQAIYCCPSPCRIYWGIDQLVSSSIQIPFCPFLCIINLRRHYCRN